MEDELNQIQIMTERYVADMQQVREGLNKMKDGLDTLAVTLERANESMLDIIKEHESRH